MFVLHHYALVLLLLQLAQRYIDCAAVYSTCSKYCETRMIDYHTTLVTGINEQHEMGSEHSNLMV